MNIYIKIVIKCKHFLKGYFKYFNVILDIPTFCSQKVNFIKGHRKY